MLDLRVGSIGLRPLSALPVENALQVWRDASDRLVAYAWAADGWSWIGWPGVAAFRFRAGVPDVTAHPDGSVETNVIHDVFRRVILPIALQAAGFEALHASGVVRGSGALLFCARSRTGKSTLAYALSQRGCRQLADDTAVLDFSPSGVRVVSLPFEPRVDALLGANPEPMAGNSPPAGFEAERFPLTAIFLLHRESDPNGTAAARATVLPPTRAFPAVLAHAHCFDLAGRASRGRLLGRYLDLTAVVPVFDLRFQPGLDRLPAVLDAIVDAVPSERPWTSRAP
jgi:hypothetical protein